MPAWYPQIATVQHLLRADSGAACVGETDWRQVQGSWQARLPVFVDGFGVDEVDLIVRAPIAAGEKLHAVLRLKEAPVRRACWNSPHREDGEMFAHPCHGHSFTGRRQMRYEPDPPLILIPRDVSPPPYARREAVQSFVTWCSISVDDLDWRDPHELRGGG